MSGAQQYLRYLSLVVADSSGSGIDLAQLRVVFRVTQNSIQTPNSLIARVYNPAPATINSIQKEFTQVQLTAGYDGNNGIIFKGKLKQRETGREDASGGAGATWQRAGRETPVDTFIDIYASDSDTAYNYAVVNKTLAAGHSQEDVYNTLAESMQSYGITGGATPTSLGTQQNPRGRVCFGMSRDRIREFAATNNLTFTLRDNQDLVLQPINQAEVGEAVIVNSASGMIGIPQQTEQGITLRTLLNPKIKFNKQLQINNRDIVASSPNLDYTALNYVPDTDADGLYKIVSVIHLGDTRGEPWYSEVVCTSMSGSQPLSGPAITSVP